MPARLPCDKPSAHRYLPARSDRPEQSRKKRQSPNVSETAPVRPQRHGFAPSTARVDEQRRVLAPDSVVPLYRQLFGCSFDSRFSALLDDRPKNPQHVIEILISNGTCLCFPYLFGITGAMGQGQPISERPEASEYLGLFS
jgi:hypothetical protein